jgi:hypothetical protein
MRILRSDYFILFGVFLFCTYRADAFNHKAFYAGLAYQSENVMGKITNSDSGSKSTLGTVSTPLLLKYDYLLGRQVFISPKFSYTLFPRSASGSTGKVTQWHLIFPVGKSISNGPWSWSAGLGILNNKFQGSGGMVTLNNGNGTADFPAPGQSRSSTRISLNTGASFQFSKHNVGLDLLTTGTFSNKRTYSIMLSYLYQFTGRSPNAGNSK